MLHQPKLLSWSAAKTRIINQIQYTAKSHEEPPLRSSLGSRIPQFPLFSSRSLTKFQFDTHLQAFTYYRANDDDEDSRNVEDIIITSLFYDDPKDPRSAVFVYFTSLTTGIIRRCLKYDFQFPSFQLLKYISRLELVVGYSNNRIYLLSNKNGALKYLTSIGCPGTARRIIYDRTIRSRDVIYVGGDNGLFVRWYLDGYDLRLGDRLKSVFINRQQNIIDMKLDPISHKLFVVAHKGCLIFDTLLNRESASVLSAHGAPVTCANIYGYSIIMGFGDGVMKIFEIGSESIPVRYQLQVHHAAMIGLLISTDGVIITGANDGSVCFYSLESLVKLGEHRFTESIERIMFVRGEDVLVKFKNDLQLLNYTLPIRSFSGALQTIDNLRVTFPVGSIPSRVVTRSTHNLFTVYNPRSSQIINIIPLSPNRITVNDFIYDSAGEILYISTNKAICSYNCSSQPCYLLNMFEVNDDCFFTKLCCVMWFSLLPEHTKKRRAFGVVFVGTTNGKLYLVPGDHGLKYALLSDTPEVLFSSYQILKETATVDTLEIFQSYETYTTRGGARYLLAIGNDFHAKFYRLSISGHEIFLRELGITIHLDAPCIAAAMAEYRIAIACAYRGYIRMYAITIHGLDEISPKDILYEHSPIKSLTGCDTLGLFATLNNTNEIMLWTRNNEAIRKLKCDIPLMSLAALNDRGDILLITSRKLYFLMISDFAPENILFDLTKKTIKDDPIELPVQFNKKFDPMNLVEIGKEIIHPKTPSPPFLRQSKKKQPGSKRTLPDSAQAVQLDAQTVPKIPTDVEETDVLGFFEQIEHDQAQAERAKLLAQKKVYPIAPDGYIPNSTIRSMFQIKDLEPVDVKIFRLRLIPPSTADTATTELDEQRKRFAVLNNFDESIFQLLNKIDILDNLENKTNKSVNWQNDDDEWVELSDPDVVIAGTTSKPTPIQKPRKLKPISDAPTSRSTESVPDVFKRLKKEPWWKPSDGDTNSSPRSMLLYLLEILKAKQKNSYEPACNYVTEIFKTYGIEPALVDQILDILINHLAQSENDPLDVHTVRTISQFMIETKNIVVSLLNFALKHEAESQLRQETINAIKFITDVNNSEDIELVFENMPTVYSAAEDTFSLKTIIERIKNKQKKPAIDSVTEEEETADDNIHPLLKKISEERWFPRADLPVTLDSIIDAILSKLPNASKTMFKTLTNYLIQLHRVIGYSKEQFKRVADGVISLLSHVDADYRLRAASVLAELGQETKAIDIALLNSFVNDTRVLVRTECIDALKKLTGITSDTVLKDCADDIEYLQSLPEENFSLQNYLNEKVRRAPAATAEKSTIDEQKLTPVHEQEEGGEGERNEGADDKEEEEEEQRDNLPKDEDDHEQSNTFLDDSQYPAATNQNIAEIDDIITFVRSRSPSPDIHVDLHTENVPAVKPTTDPGIRVEIHDRSKPHVPRGRRELPPPRHSSRPRTKSVGTTNQSNRVPIKTTGSNSSPDRKFSLLPNTVDMWNSYGKQNNDDDEDIGFNTNLPVNTEPTIDPIQSIIDDHKRHDGYYRMIPKRPILVPHKVTLGDVFGDQLHIILDRTTPNQPPPTATAEATTTMHLSDLNRNKHHLHEVEFVQLLSSLMIRGIQLHRRHKRVIPGPFTSNASSLDNFNNPLTISQVHLHPFTDPQQTNSTTSLQLPTIYKPRRSASEIARIRADAQTKAMREGINLRKVNDMEDALSSLLRADREHRRSRLNPINISYAPDATTTTSDHQELTHAMVLEQLLKAQGTSNPHHCIQQISRTYPKFKPLLHSRVPPDLISVIWNDPVMRQIASVISAKQVTGTTLILHYQRTPAATFDDENSSNFFDYTAPNHLLASHQQHRDDHKKTILPPVQRIRIPLPRHVLKFAYREFVTDPPETTLDTLHNETTSRSRRRRLFMHLHMGPNDDHLTQHTHEKNQLPQMLKTDY
ncbi:unnamed protein product [Adineta ricciae]|uniref:Uncharacterized protein n=1 Tax=Adineta ricciae TaxID=249248 RepID=A0A814SB11_ADIRI|nr:unnamed protein product [Adineta ricciae]